MILVIFKWQLSKNIWVKKWFFKYFKINVLKYSFGSAKNVGKKLWLRTEKSDVHIHDSIISEEFLI